MYEIHPYLKLSDGETQTVHIHTKTEEYDGIYAVYLNGFAAQTLDMDFGAGIDFSIEDLSAWMADYRYTEFWCKPAFGKQLCDVPDETQGFVYMKKTGMFGVILPIVSEQYKCVLKGNEENKLTARLFSWYGNLTYCRALAFLYAEGSDPFQLMKACAKLGMKLLHRGGRIREERRYPELFEYLGWCSWDAFEIRVDEASLMAKCQEFRKKEIPVRWMILDDMWAEVRDFRQASYQTREEMFRLMHTSKLYSFEADPERFPNGLEHCIDRIRDFGISVGMWHPTTGYWMGIDPEGPAFQKYQNLLIQSPDGRWIPDFHRESAYAFYSAFHDFLRSAGAAFVKIDNQSMTNRFYKGLAPVGQAAREYHDAMEASVGQHFDNQLINCMGMASEDMWNRSVSPIARCSDDFQPDNRQWFSKHLLQCAFNSFVQGQFYTCDWDMWWTDDGQAVKNSILRAVSGGPIYVSDKLDRSRAEILKPLVLSDGRILRCDRPAMPTRDCLTENPLTGGHLFKLQNLCNDSGVLAVFNLDEAEQEVKGTISPSMIDGLTGTEFAVYDFCERSIRILKADESFSLTLQNPDAFKLYIVVPMKNGFAPIGRADKFIAPKTIRDVIGETILLVENGPYAFVRDRQLVISQK